MIYPENFEQKIGFDIIKNNIKVLCVNNLSYTFVDKISFTSDFSIINNRLKFFREMFGILENNINSLPIYEVEDFRLIFKSSDVDGTFLEVCHLKTLQKLIENISILVDFLSKKDKDKYPLLTTYARDIETFPKIFQRISALIDKNGDIKDNATPELFKIRGQKHQIQSSISKTLHRILQKAQQDDIVEKDATPVIRDGRLVIPVISMNKRRIEGIIHDESSTGKTFYIEPSGVVVLNNKIRELESEERKEIIKILVAFTDFIRPSYGAILNSQKKYIQLDTINAITKYSISIKAICPQMIDKPLIDWRRSYHPILQKLLEKNGGRIVPLDISLNEQNRMVLISGPNAGGKSVCLKTVCLLQYMLQCGLPIPIDESSKAGVFDSIFIDIGDGQNIENDLSTYSSHLQNMKIFIKNSTDKTLIFIDEFGSGTEPEIGGAIAQATMEEFCKKQLFGLITTHYTNLKYFADQTEGVVNGAMLYDKNRLKPLFELKIGQAGSSFALEIAQNIGLPLELIENAKELIGSQSINYDKLTQSVIKNKIYWENKKQKIRLESKKQDILIEQYQKKLSEIESLKKETIEKAKIEAKTLIEQANAVIENAVRKIKESNAQKEITSNARKEIKEFVGQITTKEEKSTAEIGKFSIDDSVVIKGQNVVGQIVEINNKKATVVFGSIKTTIKLSELEYISNNKAKKVAKAQLSKNTLNTIRHRQLNFSTEIDIRGMRVGEAITAIMHYIDDALIANVSRIRILHGTGQGALSKAVREYLRGRFDIKSFADEHINLGGAGITVVNFE